MCTVCHEAHSTDYPKLLSDTIVETCETCHADHADYKVVHGPVCNCTACQASHESDQPKLFVKTGEQLRKTDTGGGCSPGCHKPLYYDRESPGRKPNAPKPAAGADAKKGG